MRQIPYSETLINDKARKEKFLHEAQEQFMVRVARFLANPSTGAYDQLLATALDYQFNYCDLQDVECGIRQALR